MKVELRDYLEKNGLTRSATPKEAWAFYQGLEGDQRDQSRLIRHNKPSKKTAPNAEGETGTATHDSAEAARIAEQAIVNDRKRVADIQQRFDGDFPAVEKVAINEGWTVERAAEELLANIRKARKDSLGGSGGAPAGHVSGGLNRETLQAAMMARSGVALDSDVFQTAEAREVSLPSWSRGDINSEARQKAIEHAHKFQSMSMLDLCRASLELAGHRPSYDREEMIREAFGKGTLEPYASTNINTRILMGYMESMDTTVSWTNEETLFDYKQTDMITMGKSGRLTKHARGKTADSMDVGAEVEPMRLASYSGKWDLTDEDIIDNRFGSSDFGMPEEMGEAARQLRPNLVYAILLANANLVKDNLGPLFNTQCNNLFTGSALSVGTLEAAITAMSDQRQRDRPLNLQARYLLVPPALKFEALRITRSGTIDNRLAAAAGKVGEQNVLASMNPPMVIADSRLGTAGVLDPDTDTQLAGNNANWFLTGKPGEGGAKTVTVAYLSGRRTPQIRSAPMSHGKWGICWDIKHSIGAKALDRLAMQKHEG